MMAYLLIKPPYYLTLRLAKGRKSLCLQMFTIASIAVNLTNVVFCWHFFHLPKVSSINSLIFHACFGRSNSSAI